MDAVKNGTLPRFTHAEGKPSGPLLKTRETACLRAAQKHAGVFVPTYRAATVREWSFERNHVADWLDAGAAAKWERLA
jgi:hypothetical protein